MKYVFYAAWPVLFAFASAAIIQSDGSYVSVSGVILGWLT